MSIYKNRKPLYTVYGPKMLEEMTWPEVEEALKKSDIVLPVIGAVEQHGTHSPLMSDCIQGIEVAKRAALKLEEQGISVVVGPLIPFGHSPHHMGFPGTITLSVPTFHALMKEVFHSLIRHGFKKLAVVNGHGGNDASIYLAVDDIYREADVQIAFPNWMGNNNTSYVKVAKSDRPSGEFHQGERATSLTLAARPELVDMSKAGTYYNEEYERRIGKYGRAVNLPYLIGYDMRSFTPVGYIGNSAAATPEVGDAQYEAAADFIADFVKTEFVGK